MRIQDLVFGEDVVFITVFTVNNMKYHDYTRRILIFIFVPYHVTFGLNLHCGYDVFMFSFTS